MALVTGRVPVLPQFVCCVSCFLLLSCPSFYYSVLLLLPTICCQPRARTRSNVARERKRGSFRSDGCAWCESVCDSVRAGIAAQRRSGQPPVFRTKGPIQDGSRRNRSSVQKRKQECRFQETVEQASSSSHRGVGRPILRPPAVRIPAQPRWAKLLTATEWGADPGKRGPEWLQGSASPAGLASVVLPMPLPGTLTGCDHRRRRRRSQTVCLLSVCRAHRESIV